MKSNILKKMRNLLTLGLTLLAFSAFAQDLNQAGEVFNAGNQALKDGNSVLAIEKYQQCIEMASKLGAEGEQLVTGSKAQVPGLYAKIAADDYKAGNTEKAIVEYENAIKFGELYGNPEIVAKAKENMPKLYYANGNDFSKAFSSANFVYEVNCTPGGFSVTYSNNDGGTEQYDAQGTTWKKTVRQKPDNNNANIIAQAKNEKATITVNIYFNGNLFKTASSSGDFVNASANGTIDAKDIKPDKNFLNEAIVNYQKSIDLNPRYVAAYWAKGLAYSKLNDFDKMNETFTEGVKIAQEDGDTKMVDKINQSAKKLLQTEGATKLQTKSWNESVKYLNLALKYDETNKDVYYYLGLAYNGLSKWDDAIAATQKGLDYSAAENDEFKAKFYFEMGNAYKGKAMNDKACEAFKNATFGRFAENANYEIKTTLKCK